MRWKHSIIGLPTLFLGAIGLEGAICSTWTRCNAMIDGQMVNQCFLLILFLLNNILLSQLCFKRLILVRPILCGFCTAIYQYSECIRTSQFLELCELCLFYCVIISELWSKCAFHAWRWMLSLLTQIYNIWRNNQIILLPQQNIFCQFNQIFCCIHKIRFTKLFLLNPQNQFLQCICTEPGLGFARPKVAALCEALSPFPSPPFPFLSCCSSHPFRSRPP